MGVIGGLSVLLALVAAGCEDAEPRPTDTPEPTTTLTTPTQIPTSTPTVEPTNTPTLVLTPDPKPKPTDTPAMEPTPDVTAGPILQAAVRSMREIDSFHFVESFFSGDDPAFWDPDESDADLTFEVTGAFQSADRVHKRAVIRASRSATAIDIQSIGIGDERFATDPATGEWARSQDSGWWYEEHLFGNPLNFIESTVSALGPDVYGETATLDGTQVHRFSYTIPDRDGTGVRVESLEVVIVVGVDDSLVREVVRKLSWWQAPCDPDVPCPTVKSLPGWTIHTMEFSYSDKAVSIQAPQIKGEGLPPTQTPTTIPEPSPTPSPDLTEKPGDELRSDKERAAPSATNIELADLVKGNSAFAFDLYKALSATDGNLFYSPYCISLAIAMTYAGARGETESQMAETLHYLLSQDRLHPAFNALDLELASRGGGAQGKDDEGFRLNIANAVWGQEDYDFLEDFLDVLAESYGEGVRSMDFREAPERSRVTINDWVAEQTEDRIKHLIPQGAIDRFTRMVLTNAIHFKAAWQYPFDESSTAPRPFHLLDESSIDVPMMRSTARFGYAMGEGYQAVDLPYDGNELSMTILLPDRGRFREVEESLDAALLSRILGDVQSKLVALTMPKFEFESQFRLAETLKTMGMPDAFDRKTSDFSGMDGQSCLDGDDPCLYIKDVIHRAFVSVDEEGTEAAAATAVVMVVPKSAESSPEPIRVMADRPFILLIRDRTTDAILFVGRIEDIK